MIVEKELLSCIFMRRCLHPPFCWREQCIFCEEFCFFTILFWEALYIYEKLCSLFTISFTRSCVHLQYFIYTTIFHLHNNIWKVDLIYHLFWRALYISEKNKFSLTCIMFRRHFLVCMFCDPNVLQVLSPLGSGPERELYQIKIITLLIIKRVRSFNVQGMLKKW